MNTTFELITKLAAAATQAASKQAGGGTSDGKGDGSEGDSKAAEKEAIVLKNQMEEILIQSNLV